MHDVKTPEGRLAAVLEDLEQMRREWEALGSPLLSPGSKSQLIEHPLLGMVRRTEWLAYRMERRKAPIGRPLGAQSAADRVSDRGPGKRAALKTVPTP